VIKKGDIELEIIGPHEDPPYWDRCKELIAELPLNITTKVVGSVSNDEAIRRMNNSHFFVLPTLSENFGYVFIEAMAAGCPLLISERTVWNDIDERNVGWELELGSKDKWIEKLKYCINMNQSEYSEMSQNARNYALEWLNDPEIEKATAKVLDHATNESLK
jgi:glycosyltransferase involved in cell wall biosynthesis